MASSDTKHTASGWNTIVIGVLVLIIIVLVAFISLMHFSFGTPSIAARITNSQSSSAPANFQQMIVLDAVKYSSDEAVNLGNIRFYEGSQELYSWCESGCTNTSSQAVFWVRLPNGIGPGSSVNLAMKFLSVSTNYDGNYAGEAPQLSAQYGEYDNGANVFPILYQNFAGTSTPSGWTKGGNIIQDNGITMPTGLQSNPYMRTTASYGLNSSQVLDAMVNSGGTPNGYASVFVGYWNSDFTIVAGYYINGDLGATPDWVQTGGGSSTVGSLRPTIDEYHVFTTYWPSSSSATFSYDYGTSETLSTHVPAAAAPIGIGYDYGSDSNPNPQTMQWVRIRAYPPNGVMPGVSFSK